MMHVLDVRLNVEIDRDTLQKIMEQVMINSSGHSTYEWMDLTQAAAVVSMNSQKSSKDTQQQQHFFSSRQDPRCPRKAFVEDLCIAIREFLSEGDHIIDNYNKHCNNL